LTDTEGPAGVIGVDERDVVFVSYARDNGERLLRSLRRCRRQASACGWMSRTSVLLRSGFTRSRRASRRHGRPGPTLAGYLASGACLHELEFAREGAKAIASVALGDLEGQEVPSWLSALHWTTWNPKGAATDAAAAVTMAVSTDVSWSDLHSRLQARAGAWSRKGPRLGPVARC